MRAGTVLDELAAVDGGQSRAVDRFYVTDSPSYFLIGRDGKIASGKYQEPIASGNAPRLLPLPGADEIEGLLGAAKP